MSSLGSTSVLASPSRVPPVPTDALPPLSQVATQLLSQASHLLAVVLRTDAELAHPSTLIPGSTIGKHLRHVHDHFRLLLELVEAHGSTLDYDQRSASREGRGERERLVAQEMFQDLSSRVERLGRSQEEGERVIRLDATTPFAIQVGSTVARELWFACLHATHHFALLRVIAVGELGLALPDDFGVAPSTLLAREPKL